ncbi:MAG: hypothetical protein HYV06_06070 [Deltaproteobacteria bacterium]|nr:hypothetical protein [Deltaproteobacteria bacterium]
MNVGGGQISLERGINVHIKKIYQWNRFWSPRTGQINLGDGGFLWNPEAEHGSISNPDVKSFSAIAANGQTPIIEKNKPPK